MSDGRRWGGASLGRRPVGSQPGRERARVPGAPPRRRNTQNGQAAREQRASRSRLPVPVAGLAVPGGAIGGALSGMVFTLSYSVAALVVNPASSGGNGSWNLVHGLAVGGALIGLVVGLIVGLLVAGTLAACFALGRTPTVSVSCGVVVMVAAVVALFAGVIGLSPMSWLMMLVFLAHGVGGLILVVWVAALRRSDDGREALS